MNWLEHPLFSDMSEDERETLLQYGFDADNFLKNRQRLLNQAFKSTENHTTGSIHPPEEKDLHVLPTEEPSLYEEYMHQGQLALDSGKVCCCILNGGMATRFGGVVKGCVEVVPKKSFLGFKLSSIDLGCYPIFLMNSFATHQKTLEHCQQHHFFGQSTDAIVPFHQGIAPRLTEDGELFRDMQHKLSFYAPGHADVVLRLSQQPEFRQFVERGGRYVFISNVDNIFANPHASIIGAHILGGRKITSEVVRMQPGDKGGAPVFHRKHLEILEAFRFPPTFDMSCLPVFNTNSFVLDVDCFSNTLPFHYFRADKVVDETPVIQFERLVGEITAFYDAQFLVVPREGEYCRFFPVKDRDDLKKLVACLRPPHPQSVFLKSGY
jgi:UTP--glucose-1-phosphate uridylyltransferase